MQLSKNLNDMITLKLTINKKLMLLFCCIFTTIFSFAQSNSNDTLYVKKMYFYQNGKFVSFAKVKKMCALYSEAQSKIKTIKKFRFYTYPQAVITGLSLGFGLGQILNNNININSIMLLSSGILCHLNLRFQQKIQQNQMKELAHLYNQHLR
jgi:hypothetical protein